MLENKKLRSTFQLPHPLSDLFLSHTAKEDSVLGSEGIAVPGGDGTIARICSLLDTSRELHGATRGHVIPVCVYTGCVPLLLRYWHQHQKVDCWLSNGLPTHPLTEAAAVQQAPYRTNACKRCYSFSPGRLVLLGPYCELQSRD